MEAESIFPPFLLTGECRSAGEIPNQLSQLLSQLCEAARLSLFLAHDACTQAESDFADVIYTRACDFAIGLGFHLKLNDDGTFTALPMLSEPFDEFLRRMA